MPNIIDIVNSVQVPQLINDKFISSGQLVRDSKNHPIRYAGGFAIVFPFEVNGEKWAFRCWSAELGNVERRLTILSSRLASLNLPYFCQFYYEPEGIVVDGKKFPTTRMRWIEGKDIKEFICANKENPKTLKSLASSFLIMCQELHRNKIAHGDLQHGNILIDDQGRIFLIDYDSVYLPALQGESDIIAGLADYQHPCRRKNLKASEKLDYFSELVIFLCILLIADNPSLVEKYNVEDAERLLFSRTDYEDLTSSEIYQDIALMGDEYKIYLQILQEYLAADDINDLEPFDVLLDRYTREPVIKRFEIEEGDVVYEGNKVSLAWEVENASKVLIDGKAIDVNDRKMPVVIDNDRQFELEIINGLKSAKSVCTVQALREPTISLKSSKTKVRKNKGEKIHLKWNVSNALSAKLVGDNGDLSKSLSGEIWVTPQVTTTYVLQAVGLDGKKIFTKDCKIYALEESEVRFHADKEYSFPGLPIQLNWNVTHAKSVELVGFGPQKKDGAMVVEPEQDTIYELKVCDAFGCSSHYKKIKMLPLPTLETLRVPMPDIQTALNVSFVKHPVSFNVSSPRIPAVNLNVKPISQIGGMVSPIQLVKPIESHLGKRKDTFKLQNFVNSALKQISIWKVKILKSLRKNSNV